MSQRATVPSSTACLLNVPTTGPGLIAFWIHYLPSSWGKRRRWGGEGGAAVELWQVWTSIFRPCSGCSVDEGTVGCPQRVSVDRPAHKPNDSRVGKSLRLFARYTKCISAWMSPNKVPRMDRWVGSPTVHTQVKLDVAAVNCLTHGLTQNLCHRAAQTVELPKPSP